MTLKSLIENTGLKQSYLAKEIGMNESTFKNKLSDTHTARFSIGEMDLLKKALVGTIKKIRDGIGECF